MRTANSDQTGRMPRLIWVFAQHTGHFVGFVMQQLILIFKFWIEYHVFMRYLFLVCNMSDDFLQNLANIMSQPVSNVSAR